MLNRIGKGTIVFSNDPRICGFASVAGKTEKDGPCGKDFDVIIEDEYSGETTFEQAESRLVATAVETLKKRPEEKLKKRQQEKQLRKRQQEKQLVQEYGREPTPEEIAEEIHLPVERVRSVLKMAQQPISLQAPVGDSDDTSFGDFIEDKAAENPMEEASFSFLKEKIKDVLDTLTDREREVIEQRFGLRDGSPRTLEEVGRQFSVTRERIRQIEAKALRKLRHPTRISKIKGFLEMTES